MTITYLPLLYLHNGNLLAYRHSMLYVLDSKSLQVIDRIPISLGWKEKYLSRIRIIFRTLRLGVRNAVQMDDDNILFFVNKKFYEINIQTGVLTEGFIPPLGVRALNVSRITEVEGFEDAIVFGGYLSNSNKNNVDIYKRVTAKQWDVVYSFPAGIINHIHNIVADRDNRCMWILTGDFGDAAAIWRATDNFRKVELIASGSQSVRSCVAFPYKGSLLYATDSPFASNAISLLENVDSVWQIKKISFLPGSCIYACQCGENYVFSTAVEPDGRKGGRLALLSRKRGSGIVDQYCHLYIGNVENGFREKYKVEKDNWPYPLCQFGALQFPSGNNTTNKLLIYHVATKKYDCKTIILEI